MCQAGLLPFGSDYFDAIHLSNLVAGQGNFIAEGGAKNVARRDGMGTTVLSAVAEIGRITDYYFQAIGSGTGAIAAWEANLRFIEDGRFGSNKMKLMVSQNCRLSRCTKPGKPDRVICFRLMIRLPETTLPKLLPKVLSNRKPPTPLPGPF